jgi:hypothetical protein
MLEMIFGILIAWFVFKITFLMCYVLIDDFIVSRTIVNRLKVENN